VEWESGEGGEVTDADCAADRGAEAGAGGEGDVQGVLVAFPLGVSEEAAEGAEAEADGFVSAESLCVVWRGVSD